MRNRPTVARKQVPWLYKQANLQVSDYQIELDNLMYTVFPDFSALPGTQFKPVTHEIFKAACPTLVEKIASWGLIDRLAEIALILSQRDAVYEIHRDYPNWKARNVALNLPILNCENSYTVWYEANVLPEPPETINLNNNNVFVRRALAINIETATEIARCSSHTPNWINVFVPHAPVVLHSNPRVCVSIRFHPEIFDVIADGTFDSKLIQN